MKKRLLKELVDKVLTKEDFFILMEEINQIERLIFKDVQIPLSEKLKGEIREDLRDFIKKLEKEKSFFSQPQEQLSFFQEAKNSFQKMPQIKLEIAFQPSKDFILFLKKWFKEKIQKDLILDLIINPRIVAGAVLEYQGKYGDFSLAQKIDKIFKKTNE